MTDQTATALSRRQVLAATGGALAVGVLGTQPAFAQANCEGVPLQEAPDEFPELDLRGESPAATNVPAADELVVYVHGYSTPASYARRLAATLEHALEANGYTRPVVGTLWRSLPDTEAEGTQEAAENFAAAERNADEDAQKLVNWLEETLAGRTVRLVGYSLGARVVLQALTALDGETVTVDSVSLLGAAVPAVQLCPEGTFDLGATERVFAYASTNDQVVCDSYGGYLSLFAEADGPPLGCDGVACQGETPRNLAARDVSETIADHCAYGFPDVGVVPQVVEDFETDPATVRATPEPTSTPESTPTSDGTATPADTETATPAPGPTPDSTGTRTDTPVDGDGTGFGVASAILGGSALGYLSSRRGGGDGE